jgi:hypothetical protein
MYSQSRDINHKNPRNNGVANFHILTKEKCSILTHDLKITGGHSVLVDEISEENKRVHEKIYVYPHTKLHDKYKTVTMHNENFICVENEKIEVVYMLLLESDDPDPYKVYGVYVNGGYLVETCGVIPFRHLGYRF